MRQQRAPPRASQQAARDAAQDPLANAAGADVRPGEWLAVSGAGGLVLGAFIQGFQVEGRAFTAEFGYQ